MDKRKDAPTLQEMIDSGVIKELRPGFAAKAIEGYQSVIPSAERAQAAFYRQFSCPACACTNLAKEYLGGPAGRGTTWSDEVLPNAMLRCTECGLLMNPKTGMVVEAGTQIEVPEHLPAPGVRRDKG